MFKKIQWQHPLYYMPMTFLAFPIFGIFFFDYPVWTIWLTTAFTLGYLYIVHARESFWLNLVWLYMLFYVIYMAIYVNVGMMWFFFYFVNPIVFKFQDEIVSFRLLTYVAAMFFLVVAGIIYGSDTASQIMAVLVPVINLGMLFYWKREAEESEKQRLLMEKNQHINLLSAENERNRIGRDLHDTLGHTFAILTLKTELALKQLDKENLIAVRKELEELNTISRDSMQEVRTVINNLKYRTLSEELAVLAKLFETSDMTLTLENDLEDKTLSPVIQSTLVMVVRELTNNVIKHSQAHQVKLRLFEDKGLRVVIEDDGVGFWGQLTGQELHSIRERLGLVKGEVVITSNQNPTCIEVVIQEELL